MENIRELQAYGYFFLTAFLAVTLYAYFFHLYKSEKNGRRNYEKYSKLALNDEIGGEILERKAIKESVCNG
ncbi:cytochrome c oxidase, cbb3-type, CcoQ subunit [Campylobacter concisus]|uniref:Cytochrome c oxidase subunit CcoQ n=1 Tax=Campylobacter concisus UNSW2 TaxID=1242965 RepID=U2FM23_9BACT|nr:cytochrome c oxidase, cbb3-type, CcoQ subunit [Campylobacter concisus]ERJ31692.1 Cytochrome c oxidase subunit CcoQ [Campylobacter concisus UNSW2]